MALRKLARENVELLLSIAALVTAVAAVVIALEQTKVMREEAELERQAQRISVMPSVWISTYINATEGVGEYKLVFSNRGLGPAVIERFDISVEGQFAKNWDHLARLIANAYATPASFDNMSIPSSRSPISAGMFLEAGQQSSPFGFTSQQSPEAFKLFTQHSHKLKVSLCYCSLFGGCYEAQLFKRPLEVEQCITADTPFVSHAFFKSE
ncbi:MAG: hypothetical protein GJ680_06740 [Alteromonadaceae bacterium]|nr:hypothetical protein [Alteromonadaceae bacterium]